MRMRKFGMLITSGVLKFANITRTFIRTAITWHHQKIIILDIIRVHQVFTAVGLLFILKDLFRFVVEVIFNITNGK